MSYRIPFLGFSEPISSMSHLIFAAFCLFAGVYMVWHGRGNRSRTISLSIYTFCCIFLFSMSGVYHLLERGTSANYVLKILDHAGIYLMISGSMTPFQIIILRGYKRWVPLIITWILAITGLTLTAIFFEEMPESLLLSFFIIMGWMSVFTVWSIWKLSSKVGMSILIGGIVYTLGATVDFLRWPVIIPQVLEAHEIFHVCVCIAAFIHFWSIYKIAHFPISHKLLVLVTEYPNSFKARVRSERVTFEGKTQSEIQNQVKEWVKSFYLAEHRPDSVIFKYSKVDILKID